MKKVEQTEAETLQKVATTLLQDAVILETDVRPRHKCHRLCQRLGWLPVKRKLTIRPITLGSLVKISALLLEIDIKTIDTANILLTNYRLINEHMDRAVTIVAIAVHNQRQDPPASLVRFIRDNFTARELSATVNIVLRQMDLSSFMNTIISVRGLTVMSPKDQGRSIASGQQSAAS